MPSCGVGGSAFPVDPQLPAHQTTIFWRAEVLPTVVLLAPAPTSFPNARHLNIADLKGDRAERAGSDGRHVIIRGEAGELRLRLAHSRPGQPLAVVMPLDDDLPVRANAAFQLWAHIAGRPAHHDRESPALTPQRRDRLILMLRALDGRLAEASYREIAEVFFGARRLERESWKTSSLRETTIRLVRGGLTLMNAGYRKLLRGK